MGIFLGIDSSIKVEHQELKNYTEVQGILSKNHKQVLYYIIARDNQFFKNKCFYVI
jgi:hypothetical protein